MMPLLKMPKPLKPSEKMGNLLMHHYGGRAPKASAMAPKPYRQLNKIKAPIRRRGQKGIKGFTAPPIPTGTV
jgi:hypothetical protein